MIQSLRRYDELNWNGPASVAVVKLKQEEDGKEYEGRLKDRRMEWKTCEGGSINE